MKITVISTLRIRNATLFTIVEQTLYVCLLLLCLFAVSTRDVFVCAWEDFSGICPVIVTVNCV